MLTPFLQDQSLERTLQKLVYQHLLARLRPHVDLDAVGEVVLQKTYLRLEIRQLELSALFIEREQPVLNVALVLVVNKGEDLDDVPGSKDLVELNLPEGIELSQLLPELIDHLLLQSVVYFL